MGKTLRFAMCNRNRESSGIDCISQEQVPFLGTKVLAVPLTRIIKNSIASGEFPEMINEVLVPPILKK
jgi:hypothetical protein